MKISKVKSRSLNDEVKQTLINYIKKMDFDKSNKLPREEILAQNLGISRITLRSVLTELSQDGIIFRKHGKGTFVNPEVLDIVISFNPALEFDQVIRNSGYTPRIEVLDLEVRPASDTETKKLNLSTGEKVISFKKVAFADDNPAIFCTDVIPERIFSRKPQKKDYKRSIFEYLRMKANKTVVRDVVKMSSVLNTEISGFDEFVNKEQIKPMLYCDCTNYDEENEPIIYGTIYYDTKYIKFKLSRQMENIY